MRKWTATLILMVFTTSCDHSPKKSGRDIQKETGKQRKESIAAYKLTAITKLPLGSPKLITHLFPPEWETSISVDTTNKGLKPNEREFGEVTTYFDQLNKGKSIIPPPIEKFEKININGENSFCVDSNSKMIFKYRLPDFGNYECFYAYGDFLNEHALSKIDYSHQCFDYGNLIFYNPANKVAKVVKVYYLFVTDQTYANYRFFYIENKHTIKIYESVASEGSCSLEMKFVITVSADSLNVSKPTQIKL
jgi:hypothetical protein